ncbi:hypothetical protein [Streptomyces sp. Tu 3180]|uniref:hypothetical protein n=1 Tax=Streptomyces sp. Tu 3180 TaxID=2682611 RepID=UPI00135A0E8D|nr:hypothetical protein [Streptomyces sp. Tu 3180]KAF3465474.1 hypothetical protein GL259_14775 [Streptomyces sp. Tu 3180]
MTTARARAHSADELPGKGGAGRRSPGRARFMGVLLILMSLVPAALCYAAFAAWLPSDRERHRDYRAAGPCPVHATVQVGSDCLSTWRLTVVKTVVRTGKNPTYEATLKDGDSWRGVVGFGDPGPLLERLEPGDRVTATVWRRDVVALSKDGVRQNSSDAPRDELQMNAAFGMLAALVAAQAFAFGAVRLARPRAYEPFTWNPYGRRLLITSVAVCFGVGLPAVWIGITWWTVPAVGVPVVVCAAGLMHHRLRTRAAGGA